MFIVLLVHNNDVYDNLVENENHCENNKINKSIAVNSDLLKYFNLNKSLHFISWEIDKAQVDFVEE